jgi:hypothetical protein
MIAMLRPHSWDFPLFLHVFGAMVLFGAMLAAVALSYAGARARALARSLFWTLLAGAIPAWVVMRVGAELIYSKEHNNLFQKDPTWIGVGFGVADVGLLILLLATGFAYWWKRSGNLVALRTVAGLSTIYLILLAIAWLAMSGKWGGVAG